MESHRSNYGSVPSQSSNRKGLKKGVYCDSMRKVRSKGALLVMLWAFAINATCYTFLVNKTLNIEGLKNVSLFGEVAIIVIAIACPISGWLADVYVGRHRALRVSMWLVWAGAVGTVLTSTLHITQINVPIQVIKMADVLFGIPMCLGFAGFIANGIPFGMDQMPEASGQEVSAFINWYVWASMVGRTLSDLPLVAIGCYHDLDQEDQDIQVYITIFVLIILTIAICCGMVFHSCLTIDPQSHNPWKTVLGVLKYAAMHKRPENRSARTYCEDRPPSRMDLGKDRYGGPYTNEQVEDVKTFLRIMTVIVSVSIVIISVYLCADAENSLLVKYNESCKQKGLKFFYTDSFFIALGIPLFELVINPLVRKKIPVKYLPQMLTCTFYSAIMAVVISIYILTIDIVSRLHETDETPCIIKNIYNGGFSMLPANTVLLLNTLFHFLKAIQYLLYRVSLFKFSCAQAPYSMKGLIIGLVFTVIFLSQGIALSIKEAFRQGWKINHIELVSIASTCDFWYCFTACVFSIAGLTLLSYITRWYKYRQREEPNYDRIFAEVYFTNTGVDTTSINSDTPSVNMLVN